jgi:hypothetical protein
MRRSTAYSPARIGAAAESQLGPRPALSTEDSPLNVRSELRRAADLPSLPTRDRRSVDRVARKLFDKLRHRSETDQRFLFAAASRALKSASRGRPELEDRDRRAETERKRAIDCGRWAMEANGGRLPSHSIYDRLLREKLSPEQREGMLTASQIRSRVPGGWLGLREELEGPIAAADFAAIAAGRIGPEFEVETLRDCVRAARSELNGAWPSWAMYKSVADRQMGLPIDQRACPRWALSQQTFKRHGGWQLIRLQALGPPAPKPSKQVRSTPASFARALTDREVLEHLRNIAADGTTHLTDAEINRRGRDRAQRAAREGRLVATVTAATVRQHFGSIENALFAAGVISEPERVQLVRASRQQVSDSECVGALRVWREMPLGRRARSYRAFRRAVHQAVPDESICLPTDVTIARRLGGGRFAQALERFDAGDFASIPRADEERRLRDALITYDLLAAATDGTVSAGADRSAATKDKAGSRW